MGTLSTPLSARTTVSCGARYQALASDVASDYNETAGFIGITYTLQVAARCTNLSSG